MLVSVLLHCSQTSALFEPHQSHHANESRSISMRDDRLKRADAAETRHPAEPSEDTLLAARLKHWNIEAGQTLEHRSVNKRYLHDQSSRWLTRRENEPTSRLAKPKASNTVCEGKDEAQQAR